MKTKAEICAAYLEVVSGAEALTKDGNEEAAKSMWAMADALAWASGVPDTPFGAVIEKLKAMRRAANN